MGKAFREIDDINGIEYLLQLAEGYERYGNLSLARDALQQAYDRVNPLETCSPEEHDRFAHCLLSLSRVSWKLADLQAALTYAELAIREKLEPRSRFRIEALLAQARLFALTSREQDALSALDIIEESCEVIELEQLAEMMNVRAIIMARLGKPHDAIYSYEHAWRILRKRLKADEKLRFLDYFSIAVRDYGLMDRAIELHNEALSILELNQSNSSATLTRLGAAASNLLLGNVNAVKELLECATIDDDDAMLQLDRVYIETILGLLTGDTETTEHAIAKLDMDAAFAIGAPHRIGQVAAARYKYLLMKRCHSEAEALIAKTLAALGTLDGSWWLVLELCVHHRKGKDLERIRALLTKLGTESRVVAAHLALCDAAVAGLARDERLRRLKALEAASRFKTISWRIHEAAALEMARCRAEAADIYRSLGLMHELSRVKTAAHRSHPREDRTLTKREFEVYGLLRDGKTDADIAHHLGVSLRTAQQHVSWILKKLDVLSRKDIQGTSAITNTQNTTYIKVS